MTSRGEIRVRLRWTVAFVFVLAATIAGPVLAAAPYSDHGTAQRATIGGTRVAIDDALALSDPGGSATKEDPVPPAMPSEGPVQPLPEEPSPEQTEAERIEAEEAAERERLLMTPEAIAEREASQLAYVDLTPEQAEELLRTRFATELTRIDSDPSRALDKVTLDKVISPSEAAVSVDGEPALLESSVPLRTPEDDGDLAKVALGLEETDQGFSPENSLVDLSLPKTAAGQIEVGDIGVALASKDPAASIASPFGDKDLYLPEVEEDVGVLLSPVTGGVELSAMVLSKRSPEALTLTMSLPRGAELRRSQDGGAEVINAEQKEPLARVSPPHAVDAQGTPVASSLSVKENLLILEFPHRALDLAYPILVDPVIEENWSGFADTSKLNYWNWQWSGVPSPETYIGQRSCIVTCWGNGLYVRSRSNTTYPAGSFARWWFVPQGQTSFMRRVILGPMDYDAHGCTAVQPHPYVGVWNDSAGWKALAEAKPTGWASWIDTGEQNLGPGTRTAVVGIEAAGQANIPCGHDFRLGGAVLYLDDPENPTVGAPTGYPTGWLKANSPFTLNVPVSDPGLGVKAATVSPTDSPPLPTKTLSCTGHFNSPCPGNNTFQFTVSADSFSPGEKEVRVSARDALDKFSATAAFFMKVDPTPPEVSLSGQLAQATKESEGEEKDPTNFDPLSLPVYNLTITATDGDNANAGTRRSGVKSIEVFLDKNASPSKTWTQAPCSNSCGMTQTYTLKLNELTALTHHTLRVVVKDFAGNIPREREIEFEYVPATGMEEEDVLHYFPLPNGQGNEANEEEPIRPELAVNVMNGNLVFRQLDVDVPGPAADLEVERYYNSLLPDSQDTEWGDGWTLAQTPTLEADEPGSGPMTEATIVQETGAVESSVDLPTAVGEKRFDETLQAVVTKKVGGYSLTDESQNGEGTIAFNNSGETTELQAGEYADVEYSYDDGALDAIAVDDPASAGGTPDEAKEREELEDISPTFKSAFGSPGTGNGQFGILTDVELDPTDGTLWTTDSTNNRVQHFTTSGEYLGKFSTCSSPSALAVDGQGNVTVACSEGGSVRKYSDTGATLKTIATFGRNNGEVYLPLDLAFDADGNLLVADGDNYRIQKFDAAGNFVEILNAGKWYRPRGIAVAPNGNIWIVHDVWRGVTILDPDGNVLHRFGQGGTGEVQFGEPSDIEIDQHGYAWVADSVNNRVQVLNEEGEYVTEFGTSGSGPGQFKSEAYLRLEIDTKGTIWVADEGNDRVQRWRENDYFSTYKSAFGSPGVGNGQFGILTDVELDPTDGTLWTTDSTNNRVQHFTTSGEYLGKFSTCSSPSALAVDGQGNVTVACSAFGSVRKYSDTGATLKTIATFGRNNGEVYLPLDLAFDAEGNLLVADGDNYRIQKFDAAGSFVEVLNAGKWYRPRGLTVAPNGNIWVVHDVWRGVTILDPDGNVLRRFGQGGTGEVQFGEPSDIEIDERGYAWVADSVNNRVQVLNENGEYVTEFGTSGSGPGQFKSEGYLRLEIDNKGTIWVADEGNDRVQRWKAAGRLLLDYDSRLQDDPSLEVNTAEELVTSVESAEIGEITYAHDDEQLTSVEGPQGATAYEYDEADRMTKVTLSTGTYAEIEYESTYGRVKAVTVAPEGANAKTTFFSYEDSPQRQTTVTAPAVPVTRYLFADDGSMLKWWNVKKPPTIDFVGGTLHDVENRETAAPITPGLYNLTVQANSPEGISSIEIITNSNTVASEKLCSQDPEALGIECQTQFDEWVMETRNFAPGIIYVEVIVTDALGESAAERFWFNNPVTPPPEPGFEEAPKFSDILLFREAYGLDLDLNEDEEAINDRIFNLIGDWHNPHTNLGEVARASMQRWGVPLRQQDIAEIEDRERDLAHDAPIIEQWGESVSPGTYAGYFMDHRAGGKIRVGFTASQPAQVATLEQQPGVDADDRIEPFAAAPSRSIAQLRNLSLSVAQNITGSPEVFNLMSRALLDIPGNGISVGATNVAPVQNFVTSTYGSNSGITVFLDPSKPVLKENPFLEEGVRARELDDRLYTGDWIRPNSGLGGCTLAFGAWERTGVRPNGTPKFANYALTAGHCFAVGTKLQRGAWVIENGKKVEKDTAPIGTVQRRSWNVQSAGFATDAEAIRLNEGVELPRWVYWSGGYQFKINGVSDWRPGMTLCHSGTWGGSHCGPSSLAPEWSNYGAAGPVWTFRVNDFSTGGDSGSGYWDPITGSAVGLLTGGPFYTKGPTDVTPLLPLEGKPYAKEVAPGTAPGGLFAPGMSSPSPLNIVKAG